MTLLSRKAAARLAAVVGLAREHHLWSIRVSLFWPYLLQRFWGPLPSTAPSGTPTRFPGHSEIPSCRVGAITGVANSWRGDAAPLEAGPLD
jgi:hypothetical protein